MGFRVLQFPQKTLYGMMKITITIFFFEDNDFLAIKYDYFSVWIRLLPGPFIDVDNRLNEA